jgi:hypothetical protein
MNAVEIEEAVSRLVEQPFDADTFPWSFLEAFGNKETTIRRLQSGNTNQSDLGGVLQKNNIHLKVSPHGEVGQTLTELRNCPATARHKVKFLLATDGESVEAENLMDGEMVSCEFSKLGDHFGFFLPLAGITTVKQIRENAFDIKATGRLNRLYVELLKDNPEWGTEQRREDMNHFMARLIFCFFAEDTGIFRGGNVFTGTIETMTERDSSNTHEVIGELFRSMNTPFNKREEEKIKSWAKDFPYVNGGLFAGSQDVPKFSKIARYYLLHVGSLDWTQINPDIFGSMIQAVADDEERGALGMHYTSVPNILKVLNPLFLDNLRAQLEAANGNPAKLLNLRKRLARIRIFDPACGSGNFLVIAYKEMRAIEAEINKLRGEADRKSDIPKTNFRGVELRHFSCEIARLALVIAEYQCDVLYRGQSLALAEFLPLDSANWITCGNALRLDWLSICPPTGKGVKNRAEDLFETLMDQSEIDFENAGGETYICGNPPYKGTKNQTDEQKSDLLFVFSKYSGSFKVLDYVSAWFAKAAEFLSCESGGAAFVSTNSICQGNQVPVLWPLIMRMGIGITFAHTSFKWANLATHNAGVTVVVIGMSRSLGPKRRLFYKQGSDTIEREVDNINAYLVPAADIVVDKSSSPPIGCAPMVLGNQPYEGGYLIFDKKGLEDLQIPYRALDLITRTILGSNEVINGGERFCLWVQDENLPVATAIPSVFAQIDKVREWRLKSDRPATRSMSNRPHQFCEMKSGIRSVIVVPIRSSENREFLPVAIFSHRTTVSNLAYAIYDGSLFNVALIASRLHLVWISTICGKLETRFSYSNKMGWNTFPVPTLTEQNKADLTRCAEAILLAREAHFPATIADLYDPEAMPANLKEAHERNDETLERIYIGRRFKNDTERLEKLFELYTKMTSTLPAGKKPSTRKAKAIIS